MTMRLGLLSRARTHSGRREISLCLGNAHILRADRCRNSIFRANRRIKIKYWTAARRWRFLSSGKGMTQSTKGTPAPESVHERVQTQFGAAAAAYGTSLVHGDASALRRVVELAEPQPKDSALDIATGAGHTALALAPHVARVIAYDLTREMILETRRNAAARGLANVYTQQGPAEKLPFRDASFDIVTVRQAPHHFADVRA